MVSRSSATALLASLAAATLSSGAASSGAAQEQPPAISVHDVRRQVGKLVTVCGTVVTHHCPSSSRTTFLDLETPYWDQGVSIASGTPRRIRQARRGSLRSQRR